MNIFNNNVVKNLSGVILKNYKKKYVIKYIKYYVSR